MTIPKSERLPATAQTTHAHSCFHVMTTQLFTQSLFTSSESKAQKLSATTPPMENKLIMHSGCQHLYACRTLYYCQWLYQNVTVTKLLNY